MEVELSDWTARSGWSGRTPGKLRGAQLVLFFGGTDLIKSRACMVQLCDFYPDALFAGCSTAGEISQTNVRDDSLAAIAIQFTETKVRQESLDVAGMESHLAGSSLAGRLSHEGLVHVIVLSDGLSVNGSDLVEGLRQGLPEMVSITGGLSGDGDKFHETYVATRGSVARDRVTVVAFYGSQLRVSYASLGGWDSFGPERLITKSKNNVLYRLDDQSALDLYKRYLGKHAEGLPATGLLFPLSVRKPDGNSSVVRTILGVDEAEQSLIFAGDVPQGSYARLMKASFDSLVHGASTAAEHCREGMGGGSAPWALLVSCVGRRMLLKQRVEEEIETIQKILGQETKLVGFYAYGEISPRGYNCKSELHNQSMSITLMSEEARGNSL